MLPRTRNTNSPSCIPNSGQSDSCMCQRKSDVYVPYEYSFTNTRNPFFLFLVVLGLSCCTWAVSSCGEQGLLSSCGAWASHCSGFSCCRAWALGLQASEAAAGGLRSCDAWAQLLHSMWNLPGPGIEPLSPTPVGSFLPLYHHGSPTQGIIKRKIIVL